MVTRDARLVAAFGVEDAITPKAAAQNFSDRRLKATQSAQRVAN
jgi:hypothetical protein